MKVRHRFWAAMAASLAMAASCVFLISSGTIQSTFDDLEKSQALSDLERVKASYNQVVNALHTQAADWAFWDDSYRYVRTPYEDYEASNLEPSSLGGASNLLAVCFFDLKGRLIKIARSDIGLEVKFDSRDLIKSLTDSASLPLALTDAADGRTGLLRLGEAPVLYSVRHILRSDKSGPAAGHLVMLRLLDEGVQNQIREASGQKIEFKAVPLQGSMIPAGQEQTVWLNGEEVGASSFLTDPQGFAVLAFSTTVARKYQKIGSSFVHLIGLQAIGLGLILFAIVSMVVVYQVIKPLEQLGAQLQAVKDDDASQPITVSSSEEFRALAKIINQLIQRQRDSRQALVESEARLRSNNEDLEQIVFERTRQIEFQAYHDKLTGLPNRAQFYNRLSQAIDRGRHQPKSVALLFLDLDNFKTINDSLGHDMGDALLIQVAGRLRTAVAPGDTIARLGGDEFTILMEDLAMPSQAEEAARKVLEAMNAPVVLGAQEAFVGASIGIVLLDESISTPEALMKAADTAMYHAKALGKFRYVFFSSDMLREAKLKQEIESAFRKAVVAGEITVHYQPLVQLSTGEVLGCEALARWVDPVFGEVSPSVFISIAEDTGLIIPMGWTLLDEACRQAVEFINFLKKPEFVMSVNISARQFQAVDLVERVRRSLESSGLPPQNLKLEITESILMDNRLESIERMKLLKEMGVSIALDDFGTGYSSLSTLHTFPIDTLKIDSSFINQLGKDSGADAIVEAILAMAHSLQIKVTGEGVESQHQAELIRDLGCEEGQGYLFEKPLPGEMLQRKLAVKPPFMQSEERQAA